MKTTFIAQRFKAVLLVSTLSMIIEYLVQLLGFIIVGNMLGETALSAYALSAPFFGIIAFLCLLITIGTSVIISFEKGKSDSDTANKYFSQGIICAVFLGIVLFLIYGIIYILNIDLFNISAEASGYFREYFKYLCVAPLIMPIYSLLYSVALYEGQEKICTLASVINVVGYIPLSVILCKLIGISGISIALIICYIAALLILLPFFLGKRRSLSFKWFIDFKAIVRMFKYGVNDAAIYLYMSITQAIINYFVLSSVGEIYIPVTAVVFNLMGFLSTGFDGVGQAISPLISVYRGERFQTGIKKVMAYANKAAVLEGVIVTALLIIFADFIPLCFGISDRLLIENATLAIRIFSVSSVAFSLIMVYTSYYLYMEKAWLALAGTTMYLLVFPILFCISFGLLFGENGIWVGLMVSCFFALAALGVMVKRTHPKKAFPLLLDQNVMANEFSYDALKTKESVMKVISVIEQDLTAYGINNHTILKIMLMIEETQMLSIDKNGEEKNKAIELNISVDEQITLIMSDTGAVIDPTNSDIEVSSVLTYTASSIISSHKSRQYMLTGGQNRSIFKFDL